MKNVKWSGFFMDMNKFDLCKKITPKNLVFGPKTFLGALFTKDEFTFLKSVIKDIYFDTPFDLFKEMKFSSQRRVIVYFL